MNKKIFSLKIVSIFILGGILLAGSIFSSPLYANSAIEYVDITITAPSSLFITGTKLFSYGMEYATQDILYQEPYHNTVVVSVRKNTNVRVFVTYESNNKQQVRERRTWDNIVAANDMSLAWDSYTQLDPPVSSIDKIPFLLSPDEHIQVLAPLKSTALKMVLNLKNGTRKVILAGPTTDIYKPFHLMDYDGYQGFYFDGDDIRPDMVSSYVFYMKDSTGVNRSYTYTNVNDMFIVQPAGNITKDYIFSVKASELGNISRTGNLVWFKVQSFNANKALPRNYSYLGTGYSIRPMNNGNNVYSDYLLFPQIPANKGYSFGNDMDGLSWIWNPAEVSIY